MMESTYLSPYDYIDRAGKLYCYYCDEWCDNPKHPRETNNNALPSIARFSSFCNDLFSEKYDGPPFSLTRSISSKHFISLISSSSSCFSIPSTSTSTSNFSTTKISTITTITYSSYVSTISTTSTSPTFITTITTTSTSTTSIPNGTTPRVGFRTKRKPIRYSDIHSPIDLTINDRKNTQLTQKKQKKKNDSTNGLMEKKKKNDSTNGLMEQKKKKNSINGLTKKHTNGLTKKHTNGLTKKQMYAKKN